MRFKTNKKKVERVEQIGPISKFMPKDQGNDYAVCWKDHISVLDEEGILVILDGEIDHVLCAALTGPLKVSCRKRLYYMDKAYADKVYEELPQPSSLE